MQRVAWQHLPGAVAVAAWVIDVHWAVSVCELAVRVQE
jgi:hypothetical protein